MTRDPNWFGTFLRQQRQQRGLSLERLEAESGVSAIVAGSYERRDRRVMTERAERLLDFYGWDWTVVPRGYDVQALVAENVKLRAFVDKWIDAAEARGLAVRHPLAAVPYDDLAA